MKPLYLASQSPRRLQLLGQLGLSPTLMTPEPHEDAEALEAVLPGEAPSTYVQRVTRLKLEASLRRMKRLGWPNGVVLCADTTVAQGRQILGKPDSPAHALAMLQGLQGQTHRVLTCVAVGTVSRQQQCLQVSTVTMGPVTTPRLRAYVNTGEPMGKAGAYAIQGQAAGFIEHIRGSHSGIMGLPLFETAVLLRDFGFKV
jgi:septum formation protein